MANTFKVVTKAGVTSEDIIYTVARSTTTVILGLVLGNTTTSQTTVTVTLSSNTGSRAGGNDEANQDVELVTNAPIPAGSSLEMLAGNKVVMETTDLLKVTGSGATDVCLSIMEITYMPYLGNSPAANFASVTKDTFSGNGSTTAFTLSKAATTNGVAVLC